MKKIILNLVLFASVFNLAGAAMQRHEKLLEEGFILSAIEGVVVCEDCEKRNASWFFEPAVDINDGKVVVKAGTKFQLLESNILERMIAQAKDANSMDIRLWGMVTKYRNKNYVLTQNVLIIEKEAEVILQEPNAIENPQQAAEPNDTNDVLEVPQDVLKIIGEKQTERNLPAEGVKKTKSENVLVRRIGTFDIFKSGKYFVLDSLGQNASLVSYHLLPCQALEMLEMNQFGKWQNKRFRVSGIVTQFRSGDYLLLQTVSPFYSNGNFDR